MYASQELPDQRTCIPPCDEIHDKEEQVRQQAAANSHYNNKNPVARVGQDLLCGCARPRLIGELHYHTIFPADVNMDLLVPGRSETVIAARDE